MDDGSNEDFWICVGNFLDDFRSATTNEKIRLVNEPILINNIKQGHENFAAFFAGMVEQLCIVTEIDVPSWVNEQIFFLKTPWFLRKNWRFRAWQLFTTTPSFVRRNVFGGDNMLDRV